MSSSGQHLLVNDDPGVVSVDAVTGTFYLDRKADISAAALRFDHLRSTARTAVDSVKLIHEVARKYG